jgi:methylmalonyl-CoA mutase, C-terminal domain
VSTGHLQSSDPTESDGRTGMNEKPIRVLIAKPGLDGHESGAKVIARALADAGMEVIYTGIRQTPAMIVRAAIEENVDIVGLSILSGAHNELCSRIVSLFKEEGLGEVPIIVGGIVPDSDVAGLKAMGIREVFDPGTTTAQAVACVEDLAGRSRKEAKTRSDRHGQRKRGSANEHD